MRTASFLACSLAALAALAVLTACKPQSLPAGAPAATPANAALPSNCPDRGDANVAAADLLRAVDESIDYANVATISTQAAQAAAAEGAQLLSQVETLDPQAPTPAIAQASLQLAQVADARRRYEAAMSQARDALAGLRTPEATIAAQRIAGDPCRADAVATYEGIRRAFERRRADAEAAYADAENGKALESRQQAAEERLALALVHARSERRLQ